MDKVNNRALSFEDSLSDWKSHSEAGTGSWAWMNPSAYMKRRAIAEHCDDSSLTPNSSEPAIAPVAMKWIRILMIVSLRFMVKRNHLASSQTR
jgi:hypothetical protein